MTLVYKYESFLLSKNVYCEDYCVREVSVTGVNAYGLISKAAQTEHNTVFANGLFCFIELLYLNKPYI